MSSMIGTTIVGVAALACAAGAIAGGPNGNVGRQASRPRSSARCRGSGHRSSRRVGLGDRARARRAGGSRCGSRAPPRRLVLRSDGGRSASRARSGVEPCRRRLFAASTRSRCGPAPGDQSRGRRAGCSVSSQPGTLSRPSFATPEGVARWWVRTATGHARLTALRRWPRPGFDLRDQRLHQLLVVAYSPVGHPGVGDRLGMFITAVRDGFNGRWRLLEATLQP